MALKPIPELTEKDKQRFWDKVKLGPVIRDEIGPCFVWVASTAGRSHKYGYFKIRDQNYCAHRISYQIKFGKILGAMLVCHKCDNPICVRPDHLFLGTTADNSADAKSKGRTNTPARPRGENHPGSKLTSANVIEMRALRNAGASYGDLMKRFGIAKTTVAQIVKREWWFHI